MPSPTSLDVQQLLAAEPFVRELARSLVAEDAEEVVQQVWLRVLRRTGPLVRDPCHWLASVVRSVAANLHRAKVRRRGHEEAAAPPERVVSSLRLLELEETRRSLLAAVDTLPGELRTVVLLRYYEGLAPRAIARDLGLPVAVVWRRHHRALSLLRARLDVDAHGDRRAWRKALVPLALAPHGLPWGELVSAPAKSAFWTGVVVMTTKTKIAGAAALLLVMALALCVWKGSGEAGGRPPAGAVDPLAAAQVDLQRGAAPNQAAALLERVEAPPPTPGATTGALVVHARYEDDHAPGAGVMLTLMRPGSDPRYEGWRVTTDEAGAACFRSVSPGRLFVQASQRFSGRTVDVVAGRTTEVALELKAGMTLSGIVVDAARVPVAGAQVEVTLGSYLAASPEAIGVTGADGRFGVRGCPLNCVVGARASGYTASAVKYLVDKNLNITEVELVLGPNGGAVDGFVVDAAGAPIANAVVVVGAGKLSGMPSRGQAQAFPALARSDADGRFRAIGIQAGEQPVMARAPDYAPWQGKCEVVAGSTMPLRIVLARGGVMRGSVRNTAGQTVDRCEVEIGEWDSLAHYLAITAHDGSFEFTGLPIGELCVRARHDDFGKAEQQVVADANAVVACDLRLSRGLELKGSVVDPEGQPVPDVRVQCMSETRAANPWGAIASTDATGWFIIANCPAVGTIDITVRADGFADLRQRRVDPRTQGLRLQLVRVAPSTVRITARVVGADGQPVANATVSAVRQDARGASGFGVTDNDGRCQLEPVSPGVWCVFVRSPGHPEFQSEPRELTAHASWDLGVITMVRGGTARVRLVGPTIDEARFHAYDVMRRRTGDLTADAGGYRTARLAPGNYHLLVSGTGVAAQAVPFTIRASEEAIVEVHLEPGISQQFLCELPADAKADGVSLRVQRGDIFLGRVWARMWAGEPIVAEVWLAPGDYTVTAEAGALRGSAPFTVGTAVGSPVRVTVR